jgi:lipopolysaccharide heptosyltransferase I
MEYERILIVKPSSLGDIIHSLPVLHALRLQFPKAHLAWFIHEKWADIVTGHPDLDETIPWSFRWDGLHELYRIFRRKRFDLAVDLQGLFRSGMISYLSGAKVRVGFKNGREGSVLFYTHKVDVPIHPMHALDRYLLVAKSLGAEVSKPISTIPISVQDEKAVDDLLKAVGLSNSRDYVVMNPTARWWTKRWPIERFAQLADLIQDSGLPVVLIGGESDIPEIQRLQILTRISPVSVAGRTSLKQLAAFLRRARLLITNDSGPMHLAVALGTPVVALFGPTDPVRTGPYQYLSLPIMQTVIRKPVECSPCLSRSCRMGDHRCMMEIEVDDVFEVVKKAVHR